MSTNGVILQHRAKLIANLFVNRGDDFLISNHVGILTPIPNNCNSLHSDKSSKICERCRLRQRILRLRKQKLQLLPSACIAVSEGSSLCRRSCIAVSKGSSLCRRGVRWDAKAGAFAYAQTGKPRSHAATPELPTPSLVIARDFCGLGFRVSYAQGNGKSDLGDAPRCACC